MSSPTPVQSFLGGIGLSLPVHALLLLNGNVFGISGFLHRAVRGGKEAAVAVSGLVLGGAYVGFQEGGGPQPFNVGVGRLALAGFLVGLGSKLSNGCTSGHMICGVSRFSVRSIVATVTFFITGVLTVRALPSDLPPTRSMDWTFGANGQALLAMQAVVAVLLYSWVARNQQPPSKEDSLPETQSKSRLLAFFASAFEFALALRLSNLSEPTRVLSFLSLPWHPAFDPSLAFLAVGALLMSIVLYQGFRGSEKPLLGGRWSVPKGGPIDAKLIAGAAIFGIGWGLAGVCPGPALVNLGRALSGGSGILPSATWVAAAAAGGLFA
ncbi:putative sulphur transport [Lyophyllum shimeji]|uniref:Sulphur transport n=1 Tax=Lyophyllum shimeji TaxID=47721 RepID=A0A9P3UIT2_LYOSH|nr:putative sulphur transport [Lyophyllum shimeji]